MRAFIGIDFSQEIKAGVATLQRELRNCSQSGRWKYAGNFHLTLKFLDEIDVAMVKRLDTALMALCREAMPFRLSAGELGSFIGKDSIRVLWLGLKGDMNKLYSLQESVESCTAELGFPRENRKYTPHITLGQDIVMNIDLEQLGKMGDMEHLPDMYVDRLVLFKSEQVQNKRLYSPVSVYKFG